MLHLFGEMGGSCCVWFLIKASSAFIAGMEDRDPYWARPWHSAISMAEEILERPELVRGKTVVDVG